ncbi:FkbM family methyltransferase [Methylophilaceae bacterium]|nr:FkbM family methyltransferase [Methylophilaceae bacterium]
MDKNLQVKLDPVLQRVKSALIEKELLSLNKKLVMQKKTFVATLANDFISTKINLDGFYEKIELELFNKFIHSHKVFKGNAIDVGANIGNHSLFFCKYFKKIYAFEPNPNIFDILVFNSKNKNIYPINKGLGQIKKYALLKQNLHNLGGSSIKIDQIYNSNVKIDIEKIDDFKFDGKISFIKIDVEGYEYEVLKGAINKLKKDKPLIWLEQSHNDFDEQEKTKSLEMLKELGYRFFHVKKKNLKQFSLKNIFIKFINFILNTHIENVDSYFLSESKISRDFHYMILAIAKS